MSKTYKKKRKKKEKIGICRKQLPNKKKKKMLEILSTRTQKKELTWYWARDDSFYSKFIRFSRIIMQLTGNKNQKKKKISF